MKNEDDIMAKYLVILESPGKVKKVKSFLGSSYEVIASVGHISDLPLKKFGVNLKNGEFTPTFEVYPDKKEIVKNIKAKAKKSDIVFLMMDPDREGSGIARNVADILPKDTEYKRATASSITKQAVLDAIENAGSIDKSIVSAYETRRILDRIVGWKCSFPTKQATGGKSAGRVQSAGLRIIAEREKEIKGFVPEEYWSIELELETKKGERIKAAIKKPPKLKIKSKKEADEICDTVRNNPIKVSKYEVNEASTRAYAPFTTSTMYQSGAAILNWPAKKTAGVAQNLYTDGLITYIRSDSTFIVPEFIQAIRQNIDGHYNPGYLPSKANVFSNKKAAQEAHEAIRVVDVGGRATADKDQSDLYNIIRKRTIASQVSNMRQKKGLAEFTCKKYIFGANGSKVTFDGWSKVWDYVKLEDYELPELEIGEELKLIDITCQQEFTKPPPRYSEQTFVKELEKLGIGRPSTYASIINTLLDRSYIEKNKKVLCATDMGIKVSDFLIEAGFCFINLDFTANLENDLDDIANSDKDKVCVLRNFWETLKGDLVNAKNIKEKKSHTGIDCPKCGAELLLKHSKFGDFFSCENYKDKKCDYKADVGENGQPKVREKTEIRESEFECKNCGEKLIVRINKRGTEYLGCRNFQQKKCQGFFNADNGELIVFKKKKKWKKKKK